MSLKKTIWGTKMLKLNIVIAILLISISTVNAGLLNRGSCDSSSNLDVWTQDANGIQDSSFSPGEDVYLAGTGFDPNKKYFYRVLSGTDKVWWGFIKVNENGEYLNTIPSGDYPGHVYTVKVFHRVKGCSVDILRTEVTVSGTDDGDGTSEIPEYPTVILPAIMAFGGYMVIRSRRRKE